MNAKFDIGGYVLEINDTGYLSSPDGRMAGMSVGNIGLQVIHLPLGAPDTEGSLPETKMQAFLKPSLARAIASALLSAATEARSRAM